MIALSERPTMRTQRDRSATHLFPKTGRMPVRTLLINPNSSRVVTDLMDRNVERLRAGGAHHIDCMTLDEGPPGIETQFDIDSVVAPLCRVIAAESDMTDAFVIGCFADSGLYSVRKTTSKPVLGICEAGIATAINMGEHFWVISTDNQSRNAELRLIRSYGYLHRYVGLEPIDMPVASIPTAADAEDRAMDAGARLKRQGADVLVLGCVGMARYSTALQERLGLPVVDPSVVAVAMDMGIVALG